MSKLVEWWGGRWGLGECVGGGVEFTKGNNHVEACRAYGDSCFQATLLSLMYLEVIHSKGILINLSGAAFAIYVALLSHGLYARAQPRVGHTKIAAPCQ